MIIHVCKACWIQAPKKLVKEKYSILMWFNVPNKLQFIIIAQSQGNASYMDHLDGNNADYWKYYLLWIRCKLGLALTIYLLL